MIEVSVIVANYNPRWKQLKKTLVSILKQIDISFEIVIADDGSEYDHFDKIEDLFANHNYNKYKFVKSKENCGTCMNIYRGLCKSSGRYVKIISPGDYIFNNQVLRKWGDIMKRHSMKICFGNIECYSYTEKGKPKAIKMIRRPINIKIYSKHAYSNKGIILNYLFLKDVPFGCCFMTETNLLTDYLKRMLNYIKYAEDMTYKAMLADGERIYYYDEPVVWYEYGSGISTSGNKIWSDIIAKERMQVNRYLMKHNNQKGLFKLRFILALKVTTNFKTDFLKYIIFPELILWKIKKSLRCEYTYVGGEISVIDNL